MFRARLASLALSAGLLTITGCTTCCGPSFRPFQRQRSTDCCECGTTVAAAGFDGGPMLVPEMAAPPAIAPGAVSPVPVAPPPRIVPVPQSSPPAAPYPYQPTGFLRRLFSGGSSAD